MLISVPVLGNESSYRVQHQAPTVINRSQPVNLSFDLPMISINNVQDAFLFYKYDGDAAYRQHRASYNQNGFSVEFEIDNPSASSLEYYFVVETADGQQITYPNSRAQSDPVRVDIVTRNEDRREVEGIDYTILSPNPGSTIRPDDALIAITLFYEEGAIDTTTSSLRLFLDNDDITEMADASDYFFSYAPDELAPGPHRAALRLTTPGDTMDVAAWEFNVLDPEQAASAESQFVLNDEPSRSLVPRGQVEMTAQNRETGDVATDLLRSNVQMSASNDNIRYSLYGTLTTQESPRLQPQNRYGGELYVGNWLELQGGHIYPSISRLSISGRRVQGINAALHAFGGAVNAQFLYGKINRKISNIYSQVQANEITDNTGTPIDTTYALGYDSGGIGTYRRNVTGGRLSFGRGETFQWGLNFLQVRDDTTSLATIYDFNDLQNQRPELYQGMDADYRNDLQQNPNLLSVNGNPQPKDNFVAGTDLMFSMFDNTLRVRSETAFSLLNEDISRGVLSDNNSLNINIDEDVTSELDRWSWLFILNENISVFPFRFNEAGNQTEIDEAYFPTSILANQSELNFNLSQNTFRVQYRWIGPNYVSLANSAIRRDVAGFTLSDRFQLFQNRLYVTLGYESLNDNVSNTKDATTQTQTSRANVSWYPIEQHLPRVSVGFMHRNRDNEVELFNPFVEDAGDPADVAVRNFEIVNGDTSLTNNARFANTSQFTTSISQQFNLLDLSHNASLNYSYTNTDEDFFAYGGTKSSSISFNIQSRFPDMPLNTRIGFNINNTETLGGLSDINIFGFNIGGSTVLMDDKLNLNATLTLTKNDIATTQLAIDENDPNDPRDDIYTESTTVDETESNLISIRAGGQYNLNENHAFMVNLRFTNVSSQLSGVTLPNDHMLQARYIFRF